MGCTHTPIHTLANQVCDYADYPLTPNFMPYKSTIHKHSPYVTSYSTLSLNAAYARRIATCRVVRSYFVHTCTKSCKNIHIGGNRERSSWKLAEAFIGGFEGGQGGTLPAQISTVPPRVVYTLSKAHYAHISTSPACAVLTELKDQDGVKAIANCAELQQRDKGTCPP